MSSSNLYAAVIKRWNDRSLNTLICQLYRGSSDTDSFGATPEDLDTTLPRAEFYILSDIVQQKCVAYTIRHATVSFRVYSSSDTFIETALDRIENEFDNSDVANNDKLDIIDSLGSIVSCQFMDRESEPLDKNVIIGTVDFDVSWCKPTVYPS